LSIVIPPKEAQALLGNYAIWWTEELQENTKTATFAKAQATSDMPAVCPICCKEIVKATQTSESQEAVLSDGTCKNGSNEDVLGFTRRIAEPYSIEQ